jgi:uncharacterized protein YcbX
VTITLTGINRYPLKSCRGQSVESALVEPWGLGGDRRWMVVDESGETVTAREHPRMLLVRPELTDAGLLLRAPDLDDLLVPVPDGAPVAVTVFGGTPFAVRSADASAHAWFSKVIGEPVRVVYQDDPRRRPTSPDHARDGDCVSFADAYPLLLASEESLAALNDLIAAGRYPEQGPLPMRRFRPSVVVRGAPAWDEDHWRRLRIGPAVFRAVLGCARCVITTTDPDSAELGREPLATLAKHRRWDGQSWFAMNLIPETPGARIHVGDEVEVLDREESDGPPR